MFINSALAVSIGQNEGIHFTRSKRLNTLKQVPKENTNTNISGNRSHILLPIKNQLFLLSWPMFLILNVISALEGTLKIYFFFTAAGVVPCESRKSLPVHHP